MNPLQVGTSLMAPTQSETRLPVPVRVVPNNGRLGRDTQMLTGSAAQSDSDTETSTSSKEKAVVDRNFGTLQRVEKPTCKEIQYDIYEGRMASFHDWPSDSPMRPEDLARAGFFYTHIDDKVKCPYCFGGIYNWEETDNAIGEHVRHNPRCAYLKYLVYNYLTSPVPTIQHGGTSNQMALECPQAEGGASKQLALEYPQANREKTKEVAMKAVQNLGYPLKLIQQVLRCLHQREDLSTDFILEKIFDEESKVGHSLISREPEHEAPAETLEQAVSNLYLNVSNENHNENESSKAVSNEGNEASEVSNSVENELYNSSEEISNTTSMEVQNSRPDFQSSGPSQPPTPADLDPEYRAVYEDFKKLRRNNTCHKCDKNPVNILFLPCRHLVTCEACAETVERCLQCGEDIIGTVKVYLT